MLFSKTEVNTGRQVELDLLKAFTMEYSRTVYPAKTAIRGLKLLTVGQTLNLFRYALMFYLNGFTESFCTYAELPNAFNGYFMH